MYKKEKKEKISEADVIFFCTNLLWFLCWIHLCVFFYQVQFWLQINAWLAFNMVHSISWEATVFGFFFFCRVNPPSLSERFFSNCNHIYICYYVTTIRQNNSLISEEKITINNKGFLIQTLQLIQEKKIEKTFDNNSTNW